MGWAACFTSWATGQSAGTPAATRGYLTGFTLCREHEAAVIVLTNALGSAPPEYINQGYKLVLPEIIKATESAQARAEAGLAQVPGRIQSRLGP